MKQTRNNPELDVSIIVDHDKCIANKGCRVCIDACPTDILILDDEGKIRMAYDECWYCLPCQQDCPTKAIRVEMPYLVR
ncbi:MAG: 4Fe-4S dicluster domain-containing protein [Zoogloeaceae bacterium]|jgi:NAD-dependent dihydropyrimidine dehydrogenase PreA subunit|nr:4Fe-4S dicluster domain-containing protein [Zoogloeaceae bacterium]